jgi:hypothetical protein
MKNVTYQPEEWYLIKCDNNNKRQIMWTIKLMYITWHGGSSDTNTRGKNVTEHLLSTYLNTLNTGSKFTSMTGVRNGVTDIPIGSYTHRISKLVPEYYVFHDPFFQFMDTSFWLSQAVSSMLICRDQKGLTVNLIETYWACKKKIL